MAHIIVKQDLLFSIRLYKRCKEGLEFAWLWIMCLPLASSMLLEDKMSRTSGSRKSRTGSLVLKKKSVCPCERLALHRSKTEVGSRAFKISEAETKL